MKELSPIQRNRKKLQREQKLCFKFWLLCLINLWDKNTSVQREILPEMLEDIIYRDNMPHVFTFLNKFVWLNFTWCVLSHVGTRYMNKKYIIMYICPWRDVGRWYVGRKYIRMYVCPWLDLMGNKVNCGFYPFKPLQSVIHSHFLETQRRTLSINLASI